MKKLLVIITLLVTVTNWAQEKYKYVIVPAKFDFLKEADKYGLNTLTKSFFETEGFTVFYDTDKLPMEIANNRCGVLYAAPVDQSKLFSTNILFEIKDCQGNVLLESFRGSSREKSYEAAYKESFRAALSSMKGQLKFKNNFVSPNEVVAKNESKENIKESNVEVQKVVNPDQLFALPIENGYKIVDSEPKVVYFIQNTSNENVFMAKKGDIQGTFLKKNTGWFFEYYQEGKLISEKVNVKF
jgi:hypothetical protein